MDFSTMINRRVTLNGTAFNALGGAVVADSDGEWLVYVDGLEWWDDDDYGGNVEITGLLVRESIAPDPVVKHGRHTHGAVGKALIIRDATWRFVR